MSESTERKATIKYPSCSFSARELANFYQDIAALVRHVHQDCFDDALLALASENIPALSGFSMEELRKRKPELYKILSEKVIADALRDELFVAIYPLTCVEKASPDLGVRIAEKHFRRGKK